MRRSCIFALCVVLLLPKSEGGPTATKIDRRREDARSAAVGRQCGARTADRRTADPRRFNAPHANPQAGATCRGASWYAQAYAEPARR